MNGMQIWVELGCADAIWNQQEEEEEEEEEALQS